jgi:hypothetical protein
MFNIGLLLCIIRLIYYTDGIAVDDGDGAVVLDNGYLAC